MTFKKNKLKFILLFSLLTVNCFLFAGFAHAAITDYKLEMPLVSGQETVSSLGQYIRMIFIFGLGMVGIVALFGIVFGGINYLVSGSSEARKKEGKRWIYAALSGIILLLFSYLIFTTLNPELTSLKEPVLEQNIQTGTQSSPFQLEMPFSGGQAPQTPGEYVRTFFIFGLGLVGIVALFGIVFGGVQYLFSAGNATLKTYGRQWILAALSGLALLLCSYLILATINPALVNLSLLPLNSSPAPATIQTGSFQLEMPLSGAGQSVSGLSQYIKSFFIFALGLVGVTALFSIIFGGLNYVFAGSSQTRATEGKKWLSAAISGLVILLLSFLLLNTINPELTSLKEPVLEQGAQTGTQSSPFQLEMPFFNGQQTNITPGGYIKLFFIYGLGIVGVAGLFGIVFGGLNYVFSGSSQTKATEGKQWIFSAISGIALLLCSFLILITINPQLISLQNPKLETIVIEPHIGLGAGTPTMPISSLSASKQEIANLIIAETKRQGVDPALALAVAQQESGFSQSAVSPKGALGVFQLMPSTASGHGVNPNDLNQNIRGGIAELARLTSRFNGNTESILGGYNMGEAGYRSVLSGQRPMPKETQQFIPEVMGRISSFGQQGY